jgi:hypothetical protein
MPETLNSRAPLLLQSINQENLPKRVRKRVSLTVAGKKKKKKLFQKVVAVSMVCY